MPVLEASKPSPFTAEGQPPHLAGGPAGIGPAYVNPTARLLALLIPAALLTGALGSQYIGGLHPCEMCHWQRWPHYAALALALTAFAAPRAARPLTILAALAIATSGAIGFYHAGVELGIFEGLTTCSTPGATGTASEVLASILAAPLIRCDAVQFAFLGLSMAGWNAVISLSSGALILWLTLKPSR